jgi:hypothetical protein
LAFCGPELLEVDPALSASVASETASTLFQRF